MSREMPIFPTAKRPVDRVSAEGEILIALVDACRRGDVATVDLLIAQPVGALLPRGRDSWPPRG